MESHNNIPTPLDRWGRPADSHYFYQLGRDANYSEIARQEFTNKKDTLTSDMIAEYYQGYSDEFNSW